MQRARAKIFINGGSQAVRLPKQFRVDAAEVEIWREGTELRMQPVDESDSWEKMFAEIDRYGFDTDIADRNQPAAFERDINLDD